MVELLLSVGIVVVEGFAVFVVVVVEREIWGCDSTEVLVVLGQEGEVREDLGEPDRFE